jgi:hypothetical protein
MTKLSPQLYTAKQRAADARQRFEHSFGVACQQLAPKALGERALTQAKQKALQATVDGVDQVRRHPGWSLAILSAFIMPLLKKPLLSGARALGRRRFRRTAASPPKAVIRSTPHPINEVHHAE